MAGDAGILRAESTVYSTEVNRIMRWSIFALATVGLYFAFGLTQNGQAASIYLRNIVLPLFLFQLSLLTAATYEVRVTPFLLTLVCASSPLRLRRVCVPGFLAGDHERLYVLGLR